MNADVISQVIFDSSCHSAFDIPCSAVRRPQAEIFDIPICHSVLACPSNPLAGDTESIKTGHCERCEAISPTKN